MAQIYLCMSANATRVGAALDEANAIAQTTPWRKDAQDRSGIYRWPSPKFPLARLGEGRAATPRGPRRRHNLNAATFLENNVCSGASRATGAQTRCRPARVRVKSARPVRDRQGACGVACSRRRRSAARGPSEQRGSELKT
jgi:hypothetical protein